MILAQGPKIFRYHYDHFDSRKYKECISEEDIKLLKYIKSKSRMDYKILIFNFPYEQYVWRCYPTLKTNIKVKMISRQLEFKTNNSIPKNIIFIVYLINKITCFNSRIRYYFNILEFSQKMFLYYNRYYRYLSNEKKFGTKKLLKKRDSHKLHFVAWTYHRQITSIKLQRNYLRY